MAATVAAWGSAMGSGLQAASLLARGRADGLRLLALGPDEAWRTAALSFWAVPASLPAVICLHALDWLAGGVPPRAAQGLALDVAGFVAGWLLYAALTHRLLRRTGRGGAWPAFIAVYNWCGVAQYALLLAGSLPQALGAPDLAAQTLWLVALGWALWLEWFAIRAVLAVSGARAAALVLLDFAVGNGLASLAAAFAGG